MDVKNLHLLFVCLLSKYCICCSFFTTCRHRLLQKISLIMGPLLVPGVPMKCNALKDTDRFFLDAIMPSCVLTGILACYLLDT